MNQTIMQLSHKSKEELEALRIQKESELKEILYAIDFKKTMDNQYCYQITSYGQCPSGKCKTLKSSNSKIESYFSKERIGSSLITGGYTYKVNKDGSQELLSYMFHVQKSSGILSTLLKLISNDYVLRNDMSHVVALRTIGNALQNEYDHLKPFNIDNLKFALEILGESLDRDKKETVDMIENHGLPIGKYILKKKWGKYLFLFQ